MSTSFKYSDAGLALTRQFEGLRLAAYQDSVGVWTIGYGHTGADVTPGRQISELEAEDLLRNDVQTAVDFVNKHVTVPITQGMFDALVDFAFNLGTRALGGSTLLRFVNAKNFIAVPAQFELWDHAGGRVLPGLLERRKAEAAMFRGEK